MSFPSLLCNCSTLLQFSDAMYICTVISALACATMSTVPPERGEFISAESQPVQDAQDVDLLKQALAEVDRYRSMDRLIPSYHNVVTVAVIEVSQMRVILNEEFMAIFSASSI